MNDLFRFLLLRPADVVAPDNVKVLTPTFTNQEDPRNIARRKATLLVQRKVVPTAESDLSLAPLAVAFVKRIGGDSISAKDLSALVQKTIGKSAQEIVADERFGKEEARVADSLVAMKLLSDSLGGDAPGLARLALGYDAIRLAATGRDPVSLRVLSLPEFGNDEQPPAPVPELPRVEQSSPSQAIDYGAKLRDLDSAIGSLRSLTASSFHVADAGRCADQGNQIARLAGRLAVLENRGQGAEKAGEAPPQLPSAAESAPAVSRPWILSPNAVSSLPQTARSTLLEVGVDPQIHALPMMLNSLLARRTQYQMTLEKSKIPELQTLRYVGNYVFPAKPLVPGLTNDFVGSPTAAMPTGHGDIRPVGIGDLLLVKEHVLRYEGGDLAHVENVLKSERLSRDTRRLERTETTVLQETETTKEEQRDTQTTDRFSLKRETSDTIKTDASLKAGLSVDAKYGPFVEVKANAEFATSTSTESSTKQASEFSKDVVDRSASKLVERILERRTVTTITEFEEKYSHAFDNTNGAGHISGFYQWIDKVLQAQVYNYGKRLLFDVTVPEPGTNFILTKKDGTDQGQNLQPPPDFTLTADQINESNYALWAAKYQVTGLEPPPPPVKTISKGYDVTANQDPHESSKSESLTIDEGYRALYALFVDSFNHYDKSSWKVLIGSNFIDATSGGAYVDMAGEIGSVAVAFRAYQMEQIACTIEVFCDRTERAFEAWQLKTHAAITQGYQAKQQAYEQALAQAKAAAGVVITGRNPAFNAQLMARELRRQCLTLVTGQQFDAFGALQLTVDGYAEPELSATAAQMPYVRFFEQAFEWEHIIYFFYPYFWGWKPAWKKHILLDDVDSAFGDFLRAGAARVVFPVRPGFEAAVIHYLETGEIWNGGPPPDITSPLYVSIIKEIQEATGAPGDEVPVGDPWLVTLPTTLVQLRPNNDLPAWKKVGEDWQPTN